MNWALFRSDHAWVAGVGVLAAALWGWTIAAPFGSRDAANGTYLLATGWLAAAAFVAAAVYAVRKAAHRTGLSPEFRREVEVSEMEAAQSALLGLEHDLPQGTPPGVARRRAREVLRAYEVHRVLRVDAVPDPDRLGRLRLQVGPREPLGRLSTWLQSHLYYGVAAAALVFFHAGLRVESPIGLLLTVLSVAVIATGIFGIALWAAGPAWMTRHEQDLSAERSFALRDHYRRKVDALADELAEDGVIDRDLAAALRRGEEGGHADRLRELAREEPRAMDLLALMGQRRAVESTWSRLRRIKRWMHGWRVVHVPCSVALLVLVVLHVFTVWYY